DRRGQRIDLFFMKNFEPESAGFEAACANHDVVAGLAKDFFAVRFQLKRNDELTAVGIFQGAPPSAIHRITYWRPGRRQGEENRLVTVARECVTQDQMSALRVCENRYRSSPSPIKSQAQTGDVFELSPQLLGLD